MAEHYWLAFTCALNVFLTWHSGLVPHIFYAFDTHLVEDDKTWSLEKLFLNNPFPSKSTSSVLMGPESFKMILLTCELDYIFCDKVTLPRSEFPTRGWHIAFRTTMEDENI